MEAMKREIKFRAWDKDKMVEFMLLDIADESVEYIDISGWMKEEALMQYTGLKDKNGTEIYEGDIFRQKGMDNDLIVGTIIFYDDLSYRCREGNYIFHKVKFAGEVIGNIYENPELLEG